MAQFHSKHLLLAAFIFMSLGGLLLHLRIHPVEEGLFNWWAPAVGLVNVVVIPLLFLREKLAAMGQLLNVLTVIAGTVGMAYYSLHVEQGPLSFHLVFLQSTFPDIIILWAKLPLGMVLLRLARPEGAPQSRRGCAS